MRLNFTLKFTAITLILAGSLTANAQNYHLGKSKDGVYDYHILNVTVEKGSNIVETHTRVRPGDGKLVDYRKAETETAAAMGIKTAGFEKLGYLRRKVEYNCKNRRYRIKEAIYYDMNGKEIVTYEMKEDAKWEAIPAGTMREVEWQKVCHL